MAYNVIFGQPCLKENLVIFAWSAADILGVDPQIIVHKLNVIPKVKPMKQKKRKFALQVVEAVRQEIAKLLSVCLIKEVEYLVWVSNVVVMKKENGK
ncbi:hypothetical protein E1A91_A13G123400v1 [Gossypium mustelinum]|uniref:Uncharacterized protein n=1 Tax=Gossypium mustelinum TaxID=34275 RepID=A0A5D2WHT6_GOSMU|nr:hypothetical protein E1A91_A13G123400v1 [Gossypium mustelinum]